MLNISRSALKLGVMVLTLCFAFEGVASAQVDVASLLQGRDILYDADGLIVHEGNDGGDTAQREGWYWLGVWLRRNTPGLKPWAPIRRLTFDQVLRLLEPNGDGVFYRHPKLPPWNNPHDKEFGFSRDQMIPLVAAMGVWGKQAEIRRLWDALPESALGKHSFNGSWVNPFNDNIAGQDCSAIQRRGCDATRVCTLRTDTRDCSLKTDTRSCTLQEDTRSCGHDECFLGICIHYNDPFCEIQKAAQNAIYKANKDACEVAKATQNVLYAGEKTACEAAKATQNVAYKAEKDSCEIIKAGEKATCELNKAADLTLCRLTNRHSGDIVGPMTVNLFRRAMGEDPRLPFSFVLQLPPVNFAGGDLGEKELLANVLLRIALGARNRDNTGDDLNLIVMLLMSELRFPSADSVNAVSTYATLRPYTFGSYLDTYRAVYGTDTNDMQVRMAEGVRSGWRADASAVNGAVRWYHRVESGANPQLAELYEPIINRFIYGDLTGTLSTPASVSPPPTIASVRPSVGLSSGGTSLTVTGTNFKPGTTILIGGIAATGVTVVNGTTMTAVTPAHAVGVVNVSLTVPWPGGGTAEVVDGFRYATAPAITCSSGRHTPGDFNGDGCADLATYNPITGAWAFDDGTAARWGSPADIQVPADYNGDGRTDVAVFRPSTGTWYIKDVRTAVYGIPGDIPVPADYDGNGATDIAVWRPSTGQWFIENQSGMIWGRSGDTPVVGDYNGDGRADIAVYRRSNGTWYFASGGSTQWGTAGDLPVPADYDGDGRTDVAVFRPSTGQWIVKGQFTYAWGAPGDIPIALNRNGDARADLVVYRPSSGTWFIKILTNESTQVEQFGSGAQVPAMMSPRISRAVDADMDADRRAEVAVFRPSSGAWFNLLSSSGYRSYTSRQWGLPDDVPVARDYDGDGRSDTAVFRPSTGSWYYLLSSTNNASYVKVDWGLAGDVPVPGDYLGAGFSQVVVYRPGVQGKWYIRGGPYVDLGTTGDVAAPADFDGDGRLDLAVFRPSTQVWYVKLSSREFGDLVTYRWGAEGDVPVAGDYDGDGKADLATWRPANGNWYISYSSTGFTSGLQVLWGSQSTDVPVPGDYNGDGRLDIAVWRPSLGRFYVRGQFDVDFSLSTDIPVLKR